MVDAEQTYLQPAIDHCVLALQRKFNQNRAVVYNTFQAYLKGSRCAGCALVTPRTQVTPIRPTQATQKPSLTFAGPHEI